MSPPVSGMKWVSITPNRRDSQKYSARLVEYFGWSRSMIQPSPRWWRGDGVIASRARSRPHWIAPATVNRSATKVLKRLFGFAKSERVQFEHEPDWGRHWLREPEERVRELQDTEAEAILMGAMRLDYTPFFDFVRASDYGRKNV